MARFRSEADEGGNVLVLGPHQVRHHRADRRPAAGRLTCHVEGRSDFAGVAHERIVAAVGGPVERTDRHALVHDAREIGKELADLDPVNVGRDGAKFSADLGGSIHFQVVHVLVWWCSRHVDHDDRLLRVSQAGCLLRLQQLGQRGTAQPESADAKKVPTGYSIAESGSGSGGSGNGQHRERVTRDGSFALHVFTRDA